MRFAFALVVLFSTTVFCQKDAFHLYLIGDAGEPSVAGVSYREILKQQLSLNDGVPLAVVFLGDNIYPKGMPDRDSQDRQISEKILSDQISMFGGSKAKKFFIPGNHDWKKGGKDGLAQLLNQQEWIDSLHDENVLFLPRNGCPGPVEVSLSEDLVLIIIDSQWWLHPWEKPEGENSLCEQKTSDEVITELRNILIENEGKQVVVAAHHPVYTYGEHGGVSTLKDHLFPLTATSKNLYLPLPVVGSVYPLYRKFFGNIQDTANPNYKLFNELLTAELKRFPGIIHAAGHEHALQYISKDSVHYIVSGAGSKTTAVKQKGYSHFARSQVGFVRVAVTATRKVKIEFFGSEPDPLYIVETRIHDAPSRQVSVSDAHHDSVVIAASQQYRSGRGHEKWFGGNYRRAWSQPIKVPVFDFTSPAGKPLKIKKRGGGMQTLSLRLEDEDGREYTLRSIEKFPEKAIPENFRKTFAADIVQDQISAAHPYGALAIPPLAEAAGIYHTNPRVVYLDNNPKLEKYRFDFANQLMLFEERPDGNVKDIDRFGNADDVVGTDDLLLELADDNDNHVDQMFVLKSRLFDLLIGDWDRHDDQWRWAEYKPGKGSMFRPIPRDRDQAFFVNEGIVPWLWSRRWALPKFQGFDHEIDWTPGFMFNARYFDRSFLNQPDRDDWIKTATELQSSIGDEDFRKAIRQWPTEISVLDGDEIISKLKSRKENLIDYALEHYAFLSREVEVVGSNKHEYFEVEQKEDGNTHVRVFKLNKDDEKSKLIYEREFMRNETKEIRLFGLSGDDVFHVSGEPNGMKIRVIAGGGEDRLEAEGGKVILYDKPGGIEVSGTGKVIDRRSDSPTVNEYDRKAFKYDQLAPLLYGNFNVDDGIFFGGGFLFTKHGFRKDPFKVQHLFLGSYAINTSSFNFKYDGKFKQVLGKWGIELDADIKSPNYVNNFFGLGNESVFNKDIKNTVDVEHSIEYYRMRFKEVYLNARVERTFESGFFINAGPLFQSVELEDPKGDRFIKDYDHTLPQSQLEITKLFAGGNFSWGIAKVNDETLTTRGFRFSQSASYLTNMNTGDDFTSHSLTASIYQSFRLPARVVFAVRAGVGTTTGSPEFYQMQILDGKTELRGFRKTRFYGDTKVYFNNEVRIKLANIRSYIVPASFGVSGFYDVGRVWYKDESGVDPSTLFGTSSRWHKGYGGGLWFTPFNLAVVSTDVGFSNEGWLLYARLGFLF